MKTVDHSYEQALIMYDNVHIHVIMNIIVTPNHNKNFDQKISLFHVDSSKNHGTSNCFDLEDILNEGQ